MPFVQGCGGQLNASTRERHTDFSSVPSDAFDDALKRLLDMLARPLLDPAAQLREREVLQAEFGARPRPRNPLRCRHRHSAWRSASVRGVSRRQPRDAAGGRRGISAGAARLSPALLPDGPTRTADRGAFALQQVLQTLDCPECQLPGGEPVTRSIPPLRWPKVPRCACRSPARGLSESGICLDGLPGEAAVALRSARGMAGFPGAGRSAGATARAGLVRSGTLRVPYWHRGQGVAVVELQLTDGASSRAPGRRRRAAVAALHDIRGCVGGCLGRIRADPPARAVGPRAAFPAALLGGPGGTDADPRCATRASGARGAGRAAAPQSAADPNCR